MLRAPVYKAGNEKCSGCQFIRLEINKSLWCQPIRLETNKVKVPVYRLDMNKSSGCQSLRLKMNKSCKHIHICVLLSLMNGIS